MIEDETFRGELRKRITGEILFDEPAGRHTSIGVGGEIDVLLFPEDEGELMGIVDFLRRRRIAFLPVGNWTNLIVRDGGYRGALVSLTRLRGLSLRDEGKDGVMPLYIGCQYKDSTDDVKAVVRVLNALGIKPKIGDEFCCGYVADALGFEEDLKEIKRKNREVVKYNDFITVCPTCTHYFRSEYGLNPKHVIEIVAANLDKLKWRRPRGAGGRKLVVTWHDPCDLGRRLKLFDEPRKILHAMGVELVEMKNSGPFSVCCGAGGGMLSTDKELARQMARNRMKQAVDSGAEMLVTCCPTCELALLRGANAVGRETGKKMEVVGLYRFMADHLKA